MGATQMTDTVDEQGAAVAAFDELRAEIVGLRQDLKTRLPNVEASVQAFEQATARIRTDIGAVAASPAINSTPAQHASTGAAMAAKGAEPLMLALHAAHRDARDLVGQVRSAKAQTQTILFAVGATALACALLFLGVPRWVYGPPPKPTADMTSDEKWALSQKLGSEVSPATWSKMVRSYNLKIDDTELAAIEQCNEAAHKLDPDKQCRVLPAMPKK